MGCSASKRQVGGDERNVPLVRSVSLGSNAKVEGGSPSKSSWKSNNSGNAMGSTDVCTGHFVGTQQGRSLKLKPVKEEDLTAVATPSKHSNNQRSECMDGFTHRRNPVRKYGQSGRSASFGGVHEAETIVSFSGKGEGNEIVGQKLKSVDNVFTHTDSRASSFRVMECMDSNSGLRLLLSPAATPSRSFTSSTRSGSLSKMLSSGDRFAFNHNSDKTSMLNSQAAQNCKALPPQMEGMGDSEEPGSPLFDPSILATFEKAVDAASDDNWQGSDATSSSSSRVGCSSSDTCSDAESQDWPKENGVCQGAQDPSATPSGTEDDKVGGDIFRHKCNGTLKKKSLSAKATPPLNGSLAKKDYLEGFDVKCPRGCEDKTVLYFTSLRGIRKTYEDCCTVRLILKGYGVQVDERDVWMHFTFRQELTDVVGAVLTVPRLFVKGRYIGGVEDVTYLHEEGILGNLLEGLPAESNNMCGMCGGVRFIPCTSCSGSRKLISFREVSRCPDCNENGLMMCPSCYW
eukprot:c23099_g1_i1 orf=1113-2657(+)